jgi:uncharacterized protein YkwD
VAVFALLPLGLSLQQATAGTRVETAAQNGASVVPELETRLAKSINIARARYGLRCLRLAPPLVRSANFHSLQMLRGGYFSHDSLNGASFSARVQRFFSPRGYRYWAAGENLLWALRSITPDQVVDRWLASPEHRANLLSQRWTSVGVGAVQSRHGPGVYRGRAVLVITTDFGVRR